MRGRTHLPGQRPPEGERQPAPTYERPVFHTSPDWPRKPDRSRRTAGSANTLRESTDIASPLGERCARSSGEYARNRLVGFTSYCQATRPRPHTSLRELV